MRITNAMIRNSALWSINKNEELMNTYSTQLSTGKKIQKPSDDPIVAVRALKFRTSVAEIKQFKTNAEDANSWLSVNEQSLGNSTELLKRARDLCVQGASDVFSMSDRESIVNELDQIKIQLMNEGNVNYAGRYVFTGFKTDKPLVFTEPSTDVYQITEQFKTDSVEKIPKIDGTAIGEVSRIRLGYSGVNNPPAAIGGLTVTMMQSTDLNAYKPAVDNVYMLADTGELIFNNDNVNGVGPALPVPATFNFTYGKSSFAKGDLAPEHYFDCVNTTTGDTYTKPDDAMLYQISINQDITINTMGNKIFTNDMARDFEEMVAAIRNIKDDGSIEMSLQKDLLGDYFNKMITKTSDHLGVVLREQSIVGSKVNRLDLTINRLEDEKINFTELMSLNEDVDMTEAIMNLQAQEIVYKASMMSSSRLMQQSLLDFIS